MDPAAVLRQARHTAGLTQAELADRAGTARSTVVGYERQTRSPTVQQLDRLLAACGVELQVSLAPLGRPVDEALDRALAGPPDEVVEDRGQLLRIAASLEAAGVRWAVDGRTALGLQGLWLQHSHPCLALLDDETTRSWLRHNWAKGWDAAGYSTAPTWEEPPELARLLLRLPVVCKHGYVQLRLLAQAPRALDLTVGEHVLPVLSLLDVEQGHADLAAVLQRLRERQAAAAA